VRWNAYIPSMGTFSSALLSVSTSTNLIIVLPFLRIPQSLGATSAFQQHVVLTKKNFSKFTLRRHEAKFEDLWLMGFLKSFNKSYCWVNFFRTAVQRLSPTRIIQTRSIAQELSLIGTNTTKDYPRYLAHITIGNYFLRRNTFLTAACRPKAKTLH